MGGSTKLLPLPFVFFTWPLQLFTSLHLANEGGDILAFQYAHPFSSWWFQPTWKNISQIGNLPQIGVKIKNIWNHHLVLVSPWYLVKIFQKTMPTLHSHTVDGWNPAPVEVGSLSSYLQGFIHPRWCRISAINSIISQVERIYLLPLPIMEIQGQPTPHCHPKK